MALLTRQALQGLASMRAFSKSANSILAESVREAAKAQKAFDVFLSHSYLDAAAVLGLKIRLENSGLSVYVDWVVDPQLDRSKVDRATASQLKQRMRACKSLLYAVSPSATNSKWMPWELGYFDGFSGKVALVPIVETSRSTFHGQEYLSLYPYVDEMGTATDPSLRLLWVNSSDTENQQITAWLQAA